MGSVWPVHSSRRRDGGEFWSDIPADEFDWQSYSRLSSSVSVHWETVSQRFKTGFARQVEPLTFMFHQRWTLSNGHYTLKRQLLQHQDWHRFTTNNISYFLVSQQAQTTLTITRLKINPGKNLHRNQEAVPKKTEAKRVRREVFTRRSAAQKPLAASQWAMRQSRRASEPPAALNKRERHQFSYIWFPQFTRSFYPLVCDNWLSICLRAMQGRWCWKVLILLGSVGVIWN